MSGTPLQSHQRSVEVLALHLFPREVFLMDVPLTSSGCCEILRPLTALLGHLNSHEHLWRHWGPRSVAQVGCFSRQLLLSLFLR